METYAKEMAVEMVEVLGCERCSLRDDLLREQATWRRVFGWTLDGIIAYIYI